MDLCRRPLLRSLSEIRDLSVTKSDCTICDKHFIRDLSGKQSDYTTCDKHLDKFLIRYHIATKMRQLKYMYDYVAIFNLTIILPCIELLILI